MEPTPEGEPRDSASPDGPTCGTPEARVEGCGAGSDLWTPDDVTGMRMALAMAEEARAADEVPIGAVVVRDGEILGTGRNECRHRRSALAHAEVLALEQAFDRTGDMRLPGATVYTTVEPCFMCAGALVHARIERVVWAVRDPKFGGAASLGAVLNDPRLNHRAQVAEGLFAEEAAALMRSFFREKRALRDAARKARAEGSTEEPRGERGGE